MAVLLVYIVLRGPKDTPAKPAPDTAQEDPEAVAAR
jgi:hypothetical protein